VQFYFGLPLAMVVICALFVPIYYRLKVYTAYEYLEHRFDVRVRTVGAVLFLVQRGLATGITIYAPAIVLSTLLGWPLHATNGIIGLVVILYTLSGGTQAVSQTQKHQMVLMLAGMLLAAVLIIRALPEAVSLPAALRLAGALGRMNVVSLQLDLHSRYNLWSGLTGGFFLALSYFGTDQSQVQRYLSGRSVAESRLGLLFNAILKIPMQFVILLCGVLVFVFYLFTQPPVFFNAPALAQAVRAQPEAAAALQARYDTAFVAQRDAALEFVRAPDAETRDAGRNALRETSARVAAIRQEARSWVAHAVRGAEPKDSDYIFLTYVLGHFPRGVVGLLIAVILCAAMGSTASELTALGSTSMVDLYKRWTGARATTSTQRDLFLSKVFTVFWGLVGVAFASFASLLDNLIEAVNILGSIFYGTVLGLFVVAFFLPRVTATPVLIGAVVAQTLVAVLFFTSPLGFLWYNVIGCAVVVLVAAAVQPLASRRG
jgi:Na+/proline symporter